MPTRFCRVDRDLSALNAPEVDGENEEPRGRRKPTPPTNQPNAVPLQQRDKKTMKETLE